MAKSYGMFGSEQWKSNNESSNHHCCHLAMHTPPFSSIIFPVPPRGKFPRTFTRFREEATLRWLSSDVVVNFWENFERVPGVPYWSCTSHAKNGNSTPYVKSSKWDESWPTLGGPCQTNGSTFRWLGEHMFSCLMFLLLIAEDYRK